MERTRWDSDEKNRLFDAAVPVMLANPRMSIIVVLRQVQPQVIPVVRQRNLINMGTIPADLRMRLEQRRQAASGNATVVPVEVLQQAEERLRIVSDRYEDAAKQLEAKQAEISQLQAQVNELLQLPAAKGPVEVLRDFLSETCKAACEKAVAEALIEIRGVPRGILPKVTGDAPGTALAHVRHDPNPRQEDHARLPVILLVGLKPDQRAYFDSHFTKSARLKYYWKEPGAGGGANGLADKAKGVDMAYCLMGACSQ